MSIVYIDFIKYSAFLLLKNNEILELKNRKSFDSRFLVIHFFCVKDFTCNYSSYVT